MIEFFSSYSLNQIIVFIIGFVIATKGFWDLIDYFKKKYEEKFNKDLAKKMKEEDLKNNYILSNQQHDEILEKYDLITNKIDTLNDNVNNRIDALEGKINILSDSNRNGIKAWLVETYYNSLEEEYLDDFTKDLIERRYEDYKKLGGNSYIAQLVDKMRNIPTKEEYEAFHDLSN